jgi:hypothetical protein
MFLILIEMWYFDVMELKVMYIMNNILCFIYNEQTYNA